MAALEAATGGKGVILVTGGAGFIGSHTAEFLLNRGERVAVIDEVNDYYDQTVKRSNIAMLQRVGGDRFTFYEGDICDVVLLERIWAEQGSPRRVVHMAARAGVRPSIDDPFVYVQSNVEGTTRLLEISRKHGSDSFVFASSSSVYGGSLKEEFSEEDSVDFPVSPYAATKKACELMAYTYHHLYQMNIAALRFFTVFGPRGRPDMAPLKFVDKISRGKPIQQFGDGSSSRDYTYIDDIVDGIVRSLDTPLGYQVYNLGRGDGTSLLEFISLVELETGCQASIEILPEQPGDVPRTCADISKARRLLGYNPQTPFPQGIKKLVEWYKDQNPVVDELPECIARQRMEERFKTAAAYTKLNVDPELLALFHAIRDQRHAGGANAHTIGRSDPATPRAKLAAAFQPLSVDDSATESLASSRNNSFQNLASRNSSGNLASRNTSSGNLASRNSSSASLLGMHKCESTGSFGRELTAADVKLDRELLEAFMEAVRDRLSPNLHELATTLVSKGL